jgi:iron complex transport system substrate-binding protein
VVPLTPLSEMKKAGRSLRTGAGLIAGLVMVLAVTACSNETVTTVATTTPAVTAAVNAYPLTVTDLLGRSVKIAQKPARIVTLLPTATEMLYQSGGTAIGRDSSSRFPAGVETLPAVGGAYNPTMEAIAALTPDLIIIEALSQERLIPTLEKLGASVLAVRAASVDDVYNSLTLVGKVIDTGETAAKAIAGIKGRIETVKKATRTGRSVLVLISDANRNIYAAKPASYPGALLAMLGQTNPAAGIADSGPYPGFGLLTGEQALTMNPDVILTISPAPAPAPKLSDSLAQVPGFNQMAAVKGGKVKELDPVLFLQAQGPRIADAAEQMAGILNQVAP